MAGKVSKEAVLNALRTVYDPEIPFNVVDLGLVYDVKVDDGNVRVKMTMTFPGCPLASMIVMQAEEAIKKIDGVKDVKVELVWDPPWTPDRISPELREELGL